MSNSATTRSLAAVICATALTVIACKANPESTSTELSGPEHAAQKAAAASLDPSTRPIQGELRDHGHQRVLEVWGSDFEMGRAHGYLLSEEIVQIIDGYALEALPAASFDRLRPAFIAAAQISDARREEARGMIAGMRQAGHLRSAALERELQADDLLFVNAITDVLSIGCSSLSAWGPSTRRDTRLQGAPVVVRNLDWDTDPDLLRNQLIIAYSPDAPGAQRLVSVGFAGYMGCLSCVNERGVTALFNMGYGPGAASLATAAKGFSPANLTIRDVLERGDVDGDGEVNADDLEAGLRAHTHAGSWILHVIEATTEARSPARILEVEAAGVVRRDPTASSALGAHALAATNHMRAAHAPTSCPRYRRIERQAEQSDQQFSVDELWRLGESLALDEVVHTMMIEPASRKLRVRLRQPGQSMRRSKPAQDYAWEELFSATP